MHTCTVDQNKSNDMPSTEDRAGIPQVIIKGPSKDVPTSLEPHEGRRDKVSDAVLDQHLIFNCEGMLGSFHPNALGRLGIALCGGMSWY